MVHYRRRLVVPMQRDEAFAYLSRFSSAAEWDPGVSSARMVTPEPVGSARTFALDAVFMGNTVSLRYEITEFDPPHRVVLAARDRLGPFDRRDHVQHGLLLRRDGRSSTTPSWR